MAMHGIQAEAASSWRLSLDGNCNLYCTFLAYRCFSRVLPSLFPTMMSKVSLEKCLGISEGCSCIDVSLWCRSCPIVASPVRLFLMGPPLIVRLLAVNQ